MHRNYFQVNSFLGVRTSIGKMYRNQQKGRPVAKIFIGGGGLLALRVGKVGNSFSTCVDPNVRNNGTQRMLEYF